MNFVVISLSTLQLACGSAPPVGAQDETCSREANGNSSCSNNWRSLVPSKLPAGVLDSEYAVRGEIVIRSYELEKQLKEGAKLPFKRIVPCNIGNPQTVGQNPITFHRQVLSLITNPLAIETSPYPADVIQRAKKYIAAFPKFGAYSHSKGIAYMREEVAKAIDKRDGPGVRTSDPENIFLTDGASNAVKTVLEMLITGPTDGILIPIPQYPLYSASIVRLGGKWIGYELGEDYNKPNPSWEFDFDEIRKRISEFQLAGGQMRAIAVINPGNPTGNVMSRKEIEGVIKLAQEHKLVILADEVYQSNIYAEGKQFHSFRKVALEMEAKVEVFSFMSISKGYYGECGLRGGYLHATNIDSEVMDQLYKLMSMTLCSNTLGQAMMAAIMNPPQEGDPSYPVFIKEKDDILTGLKKKGKILVEKLNKIPGVQTFPVEGAMYAFVKIDLPQKFIDEANAKGKEPDTLYCLYMVEETGVVTVPGSGFGQRPGTYHYRTTILPEESILRDVLDILAQFHTNLIKRYS